QMICAVADANALERIAHTPPLLGGRKLAVLERHRAVLGDCERWQQVEVLEDIRDPSPPQQRQVVFRAAMNSLTEELVLPAARHIEHPQDVEQRRLAAA